MLETYTVLRIDEPDFGCEGSNGEEIFVKERDALLYEMDINEGDEVFLIEGELKKIR